MVLLLINNESLSLKNNIRVLHLNFGLNSLFYLMRIS